MTEPAAVEPAPTPEPGFTADPETKDAAWLRDVHVIRRLETYAQEAAEAAAAAAVAAIPPIYDSDWIDLTYAAGYNNSNGQLAYRVYGKQVFLRGSATKNSGDFNDTAATVATLPIADPNGVEIRPVGGTIRWASYGALRRYMACNVTTGGLIQASVADAPDDPNHTGDYEIWPSSWAGFNKNWLLPAD